MIKNIVFDIGNVLMKFDPETYFRPLFEDEKHTKQICEKIFSHEAWLKYDQGIFFIEDLYEVYNTAYPEDQKDIARVLQDWFSLLQPILPSIAYMKELREEGYQIYILSNISQDALDYVKKTTDIFSYIEGGVFSYKEKVNKPDARIFEILLQRYHLNADETIFIDDSKANIHQAKQLYIHGVQYKDDKQMKGDVGELIKCNNRC